jgi:alpha-glucosidase
VKATAKLTSLRAQLNSQFSQTEESKASSPLRSAGALQNSLSRRDFLASAVVAPLIAGTLPAIAAAKTNSVKISSPNGQIQFAAVRDLPYSAVSVMFRNSYLLSARLGMIVDGVDLGRDIVINSAERYRLNETLATRGVHSTARNQGNGARIAVTHSATQTKYTIEIRAYDDGVAFRYIVPGGGQRVPDELTSFRLGEVHAAWFHDFEGHYEGVHHRKDISTINDGEWLAPPVTMQLMNHAGYAAITEAALVNYPGMGLQAARPKADLKPEFKVVLGHALPVSHPFDLRYGKDEAKRLSKPAAIEGTITTPWRVVMIGRDLNTLVNCDIINNLSSPRDEKIFAQGESTDWAKPGRAVWRYLDGGENTFEGIKEFSRLAGQLGFEYNVVEGIWQRFSEAQIRELIDYSNQQNVKLWFWKHSRTLRTPQAREEFFSLLERLGVVGAKIDFFDHEAKEIIDVYQALLRSSAEHKIMVEFHGANKPAGESRTWPNEMSREAIRGLEYRSMSLRSVHNTTLPFTRFLAGHADYTPVHFGERRRETSWAHQIASAIVFTSPLMIYAAHPQHILENPASELIKTIPSVWDETIALPQSEIGELAAFARRHGNVWFVGVMNGLAGKTISVPMHFLAPGKYSATFVRDQLDEPAAVKIENESVTRRDSLTIRMRAGGGFVARLNR